MKNSTLFQFFHWYYSPEGDLWKHVVDEAPRLASLGITHVWLPPAYKSASGINEPGYAVYDLYDLGEFDQQGTVRTRYGTREEYHAAIDALHANGIKVLADIVLNHKTGADEKEIITVQRVDEEDRLKKIGEPRKMEVHSKFTFPGRKGKYSEYIWDHHSFTGICEDGNIHIIFNEYTQGEWEEMVTGQKGNYDYLLGCDIETRNPFVREELKKWGCWYARETSIDGVSLDGLKHITPSFYTDWLDHLRTHYRQDLDIIGEFWNRDVHTLLKYIEATNSTIQLFDVPLHFNFYEASQKAAGYDLRCIFENTLVSQRPDLAVTFVDNHDTQPLQSLESFVEYWFKALANAIILLREEGRPCVFYPSVYEGKYEDCRDGEKVFIELHTVPHIETLLKARRDIAYGRQIDYNDEPNLMGWTRCGIPEIDHSGCAVLLSNDQNASKQMSLGEANAGKIFVDLTGNQQEEIKLNETGEGIFTVPGRSVSVWADKKYKDSL